MNTAVVQVVLKMKLNSALPMTLNKIPHPKEPCHIKKELLVTVLFCYIKADRGGGSTLHSSGLWRNKGE